jgi:putative flippase GtrA
VVLVGGLVTAVSWVVVVVVDVSGLDAQDENSTVAARTGRRIISFFIGLNFVFESRFVTSPFFRRV